MELQLFGYTMKSWNDFLWVQTSLYTCIPGTLLCLYKFYQVNKGKDLVMTRESYIIDWIFRVIFFYSFVYYALDSLSIFILSRITMVCYQSYLLHHVVTFLALLNTFSTKKPVFWFEVLVATLHSYVITFPKFKQMPYIYFTSLVVLMIQVFRKPYNVYLENVAIRKYFIPALASFAMMQYFNCLHMLDAGNPANQVPPEMRSP
jgi:hypothetical protein